MNELTRIKIRAILSLTSENDADCEKIAEKLYTEIGSESITQAVCTSAVERYTEGQDVEKILVFLAYREKMYYEVFGRKAGGEQHDE